MPFTMAAPTIVPGLRCNHPYRTVLRGPLVVPADLGKFGFSYFELLLMFEIHAAHRLLCEKAIRPHLRPVEPWCIPVSQSVVGKKSGMGVSFFMVSSGPWATIFLPCQPGAHNTRLLHVGWGQWTWVVLPDFFRYPERAATELESGTSKLRYSSVPFFKRFPSWPGPRFHIPDRNPVDERPAKRFRIKGKSSANKRA